MDRDNNNQTPYGPPPPPGTRYATDEEFAAAVSIFVDLLNNGNNPSAHHTHVRTIGNVIPYFQSRVEAPSNPVMAGESMKFCTEDTVRHKTDKFSVGMVDRTFGDVDSHEPRPQRDYDDEIQRHTDIPRPKFQEFLKTGIPPRGTVLVSWQSELKTELIPEDQLELLDRALYVGDVVKRNAQSAMSGTVIGTQAVCTVFPTSAFESGQPFPMHELEDLAVRGVPAEELINVHEYQEGALVIYDDWVGKIEEVVDEVAVKLDNNSVVVVENADELDPEYGIVDRLSVGDYVTTKKGNLRRGRWRYGAFDPNVKPRGRIVETRTVMLGIHWLTRRFGWTVARPPITLHRDDIESGRFFVYDASPAVSTTLPISADGQGRTYHVAEVAVGDRVRFKDIAGAASKYAGNGRPNGTSQGAIRRIPRTETLGYDMNVYAVVQTRTKVTVMWQDLTITEHESPSLIPDPNVEDDDEVWPGEIVCTKEKSSEPTEGGIFKPARVGVVQSVKNRDRIAVVRWFEHANICFFGNDILPPAELANISADTEDVSLYDIRSRPTLSRRRGDFVVVHLDESNTQPAEAGGATTGPDWFGEIIDLGLDGKVTVRLGAAKPVIDVRVPAHMVRLVYSSDMDDDMGMLPTMDGESVSSSEEDESVSEEGEEMWYEYEGAEGQPINDLDDEDWSTEEEDDDEDEEKEDEDVWMEDASLADGDVDTSKTTPETQLAAENQTPQNISTEKILPTGGISLPSDPPTSAPSPLNSLPLPPNDTALPDPNTPSSFEIVDTPPPNNHAFLTREPLTSPTSLRRITKEHKILRTSLPPNIFVRTWSSRLDLLRVLILGPTDTPYEHAPFVMDFALSSPFPVSPPIAYFHSWTQGLGPVNPNLYEDGKICLSLLGTWHADASTESWSPAKSTILQVLVSIMGLVLCKDPYYNEAGYDVHRDTVETKLASALYTERAYFRSRAFIVHALEHLDDGFVAPFEDVVRWAYLKPEQDGGLGLLEKSITAAQEIVKRSEVDDEGEVDGLRRVSLGAVVMLKRQVERMVGLRGLVEGVVSSGV